MTRPHKALRSRPRPRIRPRGVMECGSVGVLRQVGIAPRDREVGDAEGAEDDSFLGSVYQRILPKHVQHPSAAPTGRGFLGLVTWG